MSKFDDYISTLDGQDNLDPLVIVSKLSELHNEEIGTYVAKIDTQKGEIETQIEAFERVNNELTKQKADNLDLVMAQQIGTGDNKNTGAEIVGPTTIDDLFK